MPVIRRSSTGNVPPEEFATPDRPLEMGLDKVQGAVKNDLQILKLT